MNDIKDMPILIVDDYRTMRIIIRSLLRQIDFTNMNEAMDGNEALRMLRKKKYGLVISDWNMQPMNGLMLLKEVRMSQPSFQDVPFLMISPELSASHMLAAKEAGVSGCIYKPFNAAALKSKLITILGEF